MTQIPKYTVFEAVFEHTGSYANPYTDLSATVQLTEPGTDKVRSLALFWDGNSTWRFRFSPDQIGVWEWHIKSADTWLDGKSGAFECVASSERGSIRPMSEYPYHFEFQNGDPCWFFGDTGWALYTDSTEKRHDRQAVEHYIDVRASQRFNVIHSMLLSEAGWGNQNGLPFDDMPAEQINPGYWQEADERLAYLNQQGIVGGLVLGWGDKGRNEVFPWRILPSLDARKRYARYIAARYSAYNVFFLVAGEWHATIRRTPGATEESVREDYIGIGDALMDADPHGRMIGIHPMTQEGSVREFVDTRWMSFGDYQQNYHQLHERILQSRGTRRPLVNSEYGYYLRDANGDGIPDKPNSTSAQAMRHATWDIVMAGAYVVTGFGTTYFGGNRDPGPFDVDTPKNDIWEDQIGYVQALFTELKWWYLEPHDELIESNTPRGTKEGKEFGHIVPPATIYWLLADPGYTYVAYARGCDGSLTIYLDHHSPKQYSVHQHNPRTGQRTSLGTHTLTGKMEYTPPDTEDWVVVIQTD